MTRTPLALFVVLGLAACAGDSAGSSDGGAERPALDVLVDAQGTDAVDDLRPPPDATPDASLGDASLGDASLGDASVEDAAPVEDALVSRDAAEDAATADIVAADTGGADTGGADTGGADIGGADTGGADAGGADASARDVLIVGDVVCAPPACEPLMVEQSLGHLPGAGLTILVDRTRTDPVTRWGDCLDAVIRCVRAMPEGRRELAPCLERAAACDAACVERVRAQVRGGTAASVAFGRVFLERGAPCRP